LHLSRYDGAWSLLIVTQRGSCDRTYNFAVRIDNGIVTFPGFVRARGRVTSGGHVRVAISAGGKYASGSGRIARNNVASGRWSGRSGRDRCSGYWTARRS